MEWCARRDLNPQPSDPKSLKRRLRRRVIKCEGVRESMSIAEISMIRSGSEV